MNIAMPRRGLLAIATAVTMTLALALPAAADLNLLPGAAAEIAYTEGEGVNVRDMAGYSGGILTTLPDGAEVAILEGPVTIDDGSGWYQVQVDADGTTVDGWVIADYLAGGTLDTEPTELAASDGTSTSYTATVSGTDGYGLRLREAATADAATISVMPDGSSVTVVTADIYDETGAVWAQVEFDGASGYSAAQYLVADDAATDEPTDDTTDEDTTSTDIGEPVSATLAAGDLAQVVGTDGSGLNQRYEPGYASGVVAVIPEGETAAVLDGPAWDAEGNGWYQLDYAGSIGWGHGGYLVWAGGGSAPTEVTAQPIVGGQAQPIAAQPVDEPDNDDSTDTTEQPAAPISGMGDAIVAEAMTYVGTPYVWGGTTPGGFDCSGFTYYVVNKVSGNGLSRDMTVQVTTGSYVDADNLAPGDLVFFQNTYSWGLSHVGIYAGGDQFVHAGSERTGVTVTHLWDDYWGPRYLTARRVV